jgi:hypothetical protein
MDVGQISEALRLAKQWTATFEKRQQVKWGAWVVR